jgi:hypothetical protein
MKTFLERAALVGAMALMAAVGAGCKKDVTETTGPGGLPSDHPPMTLPVASRSPTRITINQLFGSIQVVASDDGSIQWTQDKTSIAAALGQPDWITVTNEDLTPGTLFMKFMDDMSHDVCNQMIAKVPTVLMKYAGPNDTWQSNPNGVSQNLRYLYLRFFGRNIASTDTTTFAPLLTVFQTVTTAEESDKSLSGSTPATEGWRAVCQAAFTSPDFLLY